MLSRVGATRPARSADGLRACHKKLNSRERTAEPLTFTRKALGLPSHKHLEGPSVLILAVVPVVAERKSTHKAQGARQHCTEHVALRLARLLAGDL